MPKNNFSTFFAQLIELPKRIVEFDKTLKIVFNGEENDYPERISRLIPNSITARQCQKLFRQFLTGKGFKGINDAIVNSKKNIKLLEFINSGNDEYAEQATFAVHVQYKLDGTKDRVSIVPASSFRKGKKDDKDYNGKFAISKTGSFQKVKKGDLTWLFNYNPKPEIVKDQIKESGGINKYPGQLLVFNPSKYDYPLAHIHPVLNDTDSEMRASVYKNKSLRKGFFGKNILVTSPMVNPDLSSVAPKNLKESEYADLAHQKKSRDDFYETAKGFVGVENNEGLMVLEIEHEGDIDKVFKHVEIPTNINDKLFNYTESSVSNNIRKAYGVPQILVDSSDGKSIFGNSGELLIQAKLYYQEQTAEDRVVLDQFYAEALKGIVDLKNAERILLIQLTKNKIKNQK